MKLSSIINSLALFATALGQSSDGYPTACTPETQSVRREWGSLSKAERRDYIDAVLCMQSRPSILTDVPGAKTRFDDFAAIHINQSLDIHLSGIFLSWHREYVYLWEKALRAECAYPGAQPYWNWALWSTDLAGSPLFDGSDTSLSGDGEFVDYGGYDIGSMVLPHGTGGGCVTSGPFVNMSLNLGPFALSFTDLPANWTAYNPRCLTRDLNNYVNTLFNNQSAVDRQLAQPDITSFQAVMSVVSDTDPNSGVHPGGHYSLGISLFDFFASPYDPAFFLHHGMVDRLWTIWQADDPETRQFALNGTARVFYPDDAPTVTLDFVQNWGVLGPRKRTEELMSATGGEYCYRYE